jgi:hypothetical protein
LQPEQSKQYVLQDVDHRDDDLAIFTRNQSHIDFCSKPLPSHLLAVHRWRISFLCRLLPEQDLSGQPSLARSENQPDAPGRAHLLSSFFCFAHASLHSLE